MPDTAQVEVSTRCNHRCLMCPLGCLAPGSGQDMEWTTFVRLAEFFPRLRLVFLQGWGEPLLHPRFLEMVALAREKGCRTGFTTNGSLLNKEMSRELLRLGVTHITISLAGAGEGLHEAWRRGSDFRRLTANIADLLELKRQAGSKELQVHLSFMLTRHSIGGLADMVRLAAELGVDRLVTPNLDCPIRPEHEQERLFGWSAPEPKHQAAVEEARQLARNLGLKMNLHPLQLHDDLLICELNPLRIFFVNVLGEVTPCVYTGFRQPGVNHYFEGKARPMPAVSFGSLADQGQRLAAIWSNEEYRRFRHYYSSRINRYQELVQALTEVRTPDRLTELGEAMDRALLDNPLPPVCQTCYKAYGA